MPTVEIAAVQAFIGQALGKLELPEQDATAIADVLMDGELRGHEDHGIFFLRTVLGWYDAGRLNRRPNVRVLRKTSTITLLDGDRGCGVISATQAMEHCISKAKGRGISAAGVSNSGNLIATAPFVMQAVEASMIGFACSNISALMPPVGGMTRTFGTNPMAFAVPAGPHFPMLLDISTSAIAGAKILKAAAEGQQLERGLVEDAQGNPITDPKDFDILSSLMLPLSGAKGYGLAMMIDVLAGVLTGSAFASSLNFEGGAPGHFLWALDVEQFMPLNEFLGRMDEQIEQIKSGKPKEGVGEIFYPGERGLRRKQELLEKGTLTISTQAWQVLENISESLGVGIGDQVVQLDDDE